MTTKERLQSPSAAPDKKKIIVVTFGPTDTPDTASGIREGLTNQGINCGPVYLDRFVRPAKMPVFNTSEDTREKLVKAGLTFKVVGGKKVKGI